VTVFCGGEDVRIDEAVIEFVDKVVGEVLS
jgi:hypothetical protein